MIKNLAIGGGSNRTLLLLALLLGLLAAILIGVYLSSLEGDDGASTATETTLVVVAATDIPPLTDITEEMLTVKPVPVDLVIANAFTETDQAVGQKTQGAVAAGEQIVQSKIISPDSAPDFFGEDVPVSLIIPAGMRGFSIQTSAVGSAGGLIRAGDRVDLILSSDPVTAPEQGTLVSGSACYVMQNVEVLALDSSLKQTTAEGDAAGLAAAEELPDASRATLAVSPDQAWQLAAVQKNVSGGGVEKQLWMSLRPFGDSTINEGLPSCQTIAGS